MYYLFKDPNYQKYFICNEHLRTAWHSFWLKPLEQMSMGHSYSLGQWEKESLSYYLSNYEVITTTENLNTIIKDHPELLL
jgi:hypothetical protein